MARLLGRRTLARVAAIVIMGLLGLRMAGAQAQPAGLEVRAMTGDKVATTGRAIPAEAVKVFTYEGEPLSVQVTDKFIAADYSVSGVLFDRATGQFARRYTVADGWPANRPEAFGPAPQRRGDKPHFIGPGVLEGSRSYDAPEAPEVAASATFEGQKWEAVQPFQFINRWHREITNDDNRSRLRNGISWTSMLNRLNEGSYLQATPAGGPTKKYTMADGLASNIITHLVPADGTLWAACVDIWDADRQQWGPGGLCRLDPKTSRWQRVDTLAGRPVRWVTLLQAVGDELWVGFREGTGIEGDVIRFGMGLYPDFYRPKTSAITLARLAGGKWTSYSRPPEPDEPRPYAQPATAGSPPPPSPTEMPHQLARVGDTVILCCQSRTRRLSGNWDVTASGPISLLDLKSGKWRVFDYEKDLAADWLTDMVAQQGEVLVITNVGLERWDASAGVWRKLDSMPVLKNPMLSAATPVGDELWVGYTNQGFGVIGQQGISRYNEKTGQWTYLSPKDLGTGSPVAQIAALANGDVYVLFAPRPWNGSAAEYPLAERDRDISRPTGLGRWSGGKWEFPLKMPVESPDARGAGMYNNGFGVQDQLLAMGDTLVLANRAGVYVGPGEWKKIDAGPVLTLELSQDGKTVVFEREIREAPEGTRKMEVVEYDLATDQLQRATRAIGRGEDYSPFAWSGQALLMPMKGESSQSQWKSVTLAGQALGVGPTSQTWWTYHRVILTPSAVWMAGQGELIRIDRKAVQAPSQPAPQPAGTGEAE